MESEQDGSILGSQLGHSSGLRDSKHRSSHVIMASIEGFMVGLFEGCIVGLVVTRDLGRVDGIFVGLDVGRDVGRVDGIFVGLAVG